MTSKAVSFKNITKKYGETTVLKNICLDINDHETTALVGESGSGKTTLLQLVNGLTLPSAGEVNIFGDQLDYDNLANARKRMGYAVQGAGLFPHMTIFENIIVMAKLDGWNDQKIAARADYVVELVDLKKELLDRFPHNLSGGQRKRIALARTLISKPDILIFDEPTTGLDPMALIRLKELIAEEKKKGTHVVSLNVAETNPRAKKLYERLGFVVKNKTTGNLISQYGRGVGHEYMEIDL